MPLYTRTGDFPGILEENFSCKELRAIHVVLLSKHLFCVGTTAVKRWFCLHNSFRP